MTRDLVFEESGEACFANLSRDLRLGFGGNVDVSIVGTHHSKSQHLPIVAAERPGWNTSVAWYAYNYYNHYTAFRFERTLPATLLWPISGTMGRKHNSGHETECPLPDITNFVKDYWNRRPLEGFACFAGEWHMATTLRYLEAVSKIDQKALFDVTMDQTRHGAMDTIDGNAVDFKALCEVVGIPTLDTYDKDVAVPTNRVIDAIVVDWFGIQTSVRPCAVEIIAQPGMLLPGPSGTGGVYVEPCDTRLDEVLGPTRQLRVTKNREYKDPRWLNFVPVDVFHDTGRAPNYTTRRARLRATPWSVSHAYNVTNLDATRFRFAVPNPLDAVLFVKWWLEAAIPCAEQLLSQT